MLTNVLISLSATLSFLSLRLVSLFLLLLSLPPCHFSCSQIFGGSQQDIKRFLFRSQFLCNMFGKSIWEVEISCKANVGRFTLHPNPTRNQVNCRELTFECAPLEFVGAPSSAARTNRCDAKE